MKKFEFKPVEQQTTTFTGYNFYNIYKNSEFLRSSENIETLLYRGGYELRKKLKEELPGETVEVTGMILERNTPLLVKNTGGKDDKIKVEDYEFTINRLTGLVAAYAFDNRHGFPNIKSSEAIGLGLTWDNSNTEKCRLYLSAVTGSEHFYEQFSFCPLICALRKLQLGKITLDLVVKMAKIRNNDGERLAIDLKRNYVIVTILWAYFPGSEQHDLTKLLANAPEKLKRAFNDE